jgi:3-dehydroquinate dehydratase I
MSVPRTVKATSRPRSVGVIFSRQDLQRALRLRKRPDLFELRLDGLVSLVDRLPDAIPKLRRSLIITARSPHEGGANDLSPARRRELLLRFLPDAAFVDVELSCAISFSPVLKLAHKRKVQVILSRHVLTKMPEFAALLALANRARSLGADIFKIVARTDEPAQLQNLAELVNSKLSPLRISAMGVGHLGRISRAVLAHAGSALNYAHLGDAAIEGQWSLAEFRAAIRRR